MLEIKIGDRIAETEFLGRDGNKARIIVDGKTYEVDIVMVEQDVYSLLYQGKSYNIELIKTKEAKKFTVNTYKDSYDVQIIDAETKYLNSRNQGNDEDEGKIISTPMPGKVVKILVKPGDEVNAGTTLIIVEAMKMQSEYKAKTDRHIQEILVEEGQAITANQPLIILE